MQVLVAQMYFNGYGIPEDHQKLHESDLQFGELAINAQVIMQAILTQKSCWMTLNKMRRALGLFILLIKCTKLHLAFDAFFCHVRVQKSFTSSPTTNKCRSKCEIDREMMHDDREMEEMYPVKTEDEHLLLRQHHHEDHIPTSILLHLYLGHFLARWGARTWEFSVGLYMINVWPDSLLLAAAYGVAESASTTLFGPLVGQWIDNSTYPKVLRFWLLTQNLSFFVAGVAMVGLLVSPDLRVTSALTFALLVVLTNLSGAVAVLSTLAGTILIEREWVVVISEGNSSNILTKLNSTIRRIDLISTLFAPVITGFVISFVSMTASAVSLAIWNILSAFFQYWLLNSVYKGIPALSESNRKRGLKLATPNHLEQAPSTDHQEQTSQHHDTYDYPTDVSWGNSMVRKLVKRVSDSSFIRSWRVYVQQDVVLPDVVLDLLFQFWDFDDCNIGVGWNTSIHNWNGQRDKRNNWYFRHIFWTCLLVCVGSIWVKNTTTSAYLLMVGVAVSRLGLWVFDLSVIQQMQDQVPESDRAVVGGVQNSIQSFWDLMTYIMGLFISNPQVIFLHLLEY
ncbi:hypothetical protein L1987_50304 [Smallanthus sonchifolius]|uniref:Uncharacterized protein n=1 Tax=Smallanthus sonchifolius TaxID=185202 RepID=A0ACB9EMY1_9ASTR|nr:hypothetical protein L1987_50304 [Smallanthus sonchifolius]